MILIFILTSSTAELGFRWIFTRFQGLCSVFVLLDNSVVVVGVQHVVPGSPSNKLLMLMPFGQLLIGVAFSLGRWREALEAKCLPMSGLPPTRPHALMLWGSRPPDLPVGWLPTPKLSAGGFGGGSPPTGSLGGGSPPGIRRRVCGAAAPFERPLKGHLLSR